MEQALRVVVTYPTVHGKNEAAEKLKKSQPPIGGYLGGLFSLDPNSEKVCFEYEATPVDEAKHAKDFARNINEAYETLRKAMFEAQSEEREGIINDAYKKATSTMVMAAKPQGKLKICITLPTRIQACSIEPPTILSTICTIMQFDESDVELTIAF